MGSRVGCLLGVLGAIGLSTVSPAVTPALAQGSGDGFLFRAPSAEFRVHGGFAHASAGSDIFSYTRELLTLERRDFDGAAFGGDVAIRLTDRVDLMVGGSYAGRSRESEHRDWVENGQPILQTTTFQRVPVMASVRGYLTPRGRQIGSHAWVPAPLAPYVGVGAGALWYRFRQDGDFVLDHHLPEPPIHTMRLDSNGWAPAAHGFAGVDLTITPRIALTGEARYLWSRTDLDRTVFDEFQPIDLSGISASIGLSLRL